MKSLGHNLGSKTKSIAVIVIFSAVFFASSVFADQPIVETTIEIKKTGSEPFSTSDGDDDCADGSTFDTSRTFSDGSAILDLNNGPNQEGKDTCSDNDVVRLGDSVTYKVEISNNDSDVDYLTATVSLDPYSPATQLPDVNGTIHQEWITIPSGCETDLQFANPISELQDLDGDGRYETLYCNMGFAREGTNKVFFPAAKILAASTDGTTATINDSIVGASVTASAISNSAATGNNGTAVADSDGPAEALVTANFAVNLKKDLVGLSFDEDGNPIYPRLKEKAGPLGERGYIVEYDINAVYQQGSMIADSPDELVDTDGDSYFFDADFDIIDVFTDNNTNNNGGSLSSNGVLYDWDAATNPCAFQGDNGAGAVATCTQTDYPIDFSGATFVPDGFDDANIHMDLDNIDVRDPDADGTLFNVRITIWIPFTDVTSSQTCVGGTCEHFIINEAQNLDTTTNMPNTFSPVSTEDAGGMNLPNYAGASEPGGIGSADQGTANSDNMSYSLFVASSPGSWSFRNTFQRTGTSGTVPKIKDQLRAKNQVVPLDMIIYDYRKIDGGRSQVCNKIDTLQYEFVGIAPLFKYPVTGDSGTWNTLHFYDIQNAVRTNITQNNPSITMWGGDNGTYRYVDGEDYISQLYSNEPNVTLNEQRTDVCEDDVNNDGVVNIMDENGVESNPGNPVDWYRDFTMVPAAGDGTSGVTKVRMETIYDKVDMDTEYPTHKYWTAVTQYELKVRADATGYGPKNYMPNFANARRTSTLDNTTFLAWSAFGTADTEDPNAVNFGYNLYESDRNILVPSGISVAKKTVPEGIKVVRGGDIVQFEIEPKVFGIWTGTQIGTLTDNLPAGTAYIGGSEEFSVNGGNTWMDYATYIASNPDVTLTSSATPDDQDPIIWTFGSLDAGDSMPLVRYKVLVDPSLTSGNFKNTVTWASPNIAADLLTIDTDGDKVGDTGNGVGDNVRASYQLTILPKFGFDVLKQVTQEVYSVNEPFVFDLSYKNLGGEAYDGGQFIDILPFNGDALTSIGGEVAQRDPATSYNGYYSLTEVSFANNEQFFVTDVDPSTLNIDPCASSNQPVGYVPVVGDICHQDYINNGNLLPDGQPAGTFAANWQACAVVSSPLNVASDCPIAADLVTALRFTSQTVPTAGGQTVSITLDPVGNYGGTPVYTADANGIQVVDWTNSPAIGDVYTNSFGGRIPEISLNVISNDVTTTPVWGSVGDQVWWDLDGDGVNDADEDPIEGIELALLDANGDPVCVDPATGVIVFAADKALYEATMGVTLEPYTATTNADGEYIFENLPAGDYSIEVVDIPGHETYDFDDGLSAADSIADFTLEEETDPITGNILGIEDKDDVDFGYIPFEFDLELGKAIVTPGPYVLGETVSFTVTVVNNGPDSADDVEITDTATGLTYVAGSENASQGTYANNLWTVGTLAANQTETLTIDYVISAAALTDPVFNFAEITNDGDIGSDIDSQPGDNTSGNGPDDSESDAELSSGTDTHDDEAAASLPLVSDPAIEIVKTAGTALDGEIFIHSTTNPVTFIYVITNTGGTDLSDMTIVDDFGTPLDALDDVTLTATECADLAGPLAPTEQITCTLELPVGYLQGPYLNSASTEGVPTDVNGDPIAGLDNPTDDDSADVLVPPAIEIVKTAGLAADGANEVINPLGPVEFSFSITNTGGTYLTDIEIVDDAGTVTIVSDDVTITAVECPDLAGPLAPGAVVACVAEIDVSLVSHVNNAAVSGTPTDVSGTPFTQFDDPVDQDDATVISPAISLDKTLYETHDGGVQCNTPAAVDELILVDKVPGDKFLTYCFTITNTGGTYLDLPTVNDTTIGITDADMTLIGAPTVPLAPGESVTYFYEHVTDASLNNEATTAANAVDETGVDAGVAPVEAVDTNAVFTYVFDPPFGLKTGTFDGKDVISWEMVWINDSVIQANGVVVIDEPPVDTTYNGNLSCSTNGITVIHSCNYIAPSAGFPRGNIEVVADIAPDTGIADPALAVNALRIAFDVLIDRPENGGVYENQSELQWDADGDGSVDFEVVTDDPTQAGLSDPTRIEIAGLADTGSSPIAFVALGSFIIAATITIAGRSKRIEETA